MARASRALNESLMCAAVRNNADHQHFDKVTRTDVAEMYQSVRNFMAERLV